MLGAGPMSVLLFFGWAGIGLALCRGLHWEALRCAIITGLQYHDTCMEGDSKLPYCCSHVSHLILFLRGPVMQVSFATWESCEEVAKIHLASHRVLFCGLVGLPASGR